MKILSEPEAGFIETVASRLAEKFIKPLLLFSKEKSYPAHIGGLAEILDWSMEFYEKYYEQIITSERYNEGGGTNYKTAEFDDLIVAFGKDRIKKFYTQNANHATYFIEKYSASES